MVETRTWHGIRLPRCRHDRNSNCHGIAHDRNSNCHGIATIAIRSITFHVKNCHGIATIAIRIATVPPRSQFELPRYRHDRNSHGPRSNYLSPSRGLDLALNDSCACLAAKLCARSLVLVTRAPSRRAFSSAVCLAIAAEPVFAILAAFSR